MNLDVTRRTAPMKVAIGLLYRELDANKNEQSVTMHRALFESVIHTLELSVHDLESRLRSSEDRKAVDSQARVATASRS